MSADEEFHGGFAMMNSESIRELLQKKLYQTHGDWCHDCGDGSDESSIVDVIWPEIQSLLAEAEFHIRDYTSHHIGYKSGTEDSAPCRCNAHRFLDALGPKEQT